MNKWQQFSQVLPPEDKRVLVSDGEMISIARYNVDDQHIIWFFDRSESKDMKIIYWMELPPMPDPENTVDTSQN